MSSSLVEIFVLEYGTQLYVKWLKLLNFLHVFLNSEQADY